MHEQDNSWAPAFLCCSYLTLFLHIETSFKCLCCKTALPPNIWPSCSWGPGLAPWKDKSEGKFLLITPGSSFNQQIQVFKKASKNCLIIKGYLFSFLYFANRRKLMLSKESHLFYFHIMVYILNAQIQLFCYLDIQLQLLLKPYLHILTEMHTQSGLRNCEAFTYKFTLESISGMK